MKNLSTKPCSVFRSLSVGITNFLPPMDECRKLNLLYLSHFHSNVLFPREPITPLNDESQIFKSSRNISLFSTHWASPVPLFSIANRTMAFQVPFVFASIFSVVHCYDCIDISNFWYIRSVQMSGRGGQWAIESTQISVNNVTPGVKRSQSSWVYPFRLPRVRVADRGRRWRARRETSLTCLCSMEGLFVS